MKADELLEQCTKQIDEVICEYATVAAQHLLHAGASVDDLPRLMRPIVEELAKRRAAAVAKLERRAAPMRVLEHRIRVIEAQIELLEAERRCTNAVETADLEHLAAIRMAQGQRSSMA